MLYRVAFINVNFGTFVQVVNCRHYVKSKNNHDYSWTPTVQHDNIPVTCTIMVLYLLKVLTMWAHVSRYTRRFLVSALFV